MGSRKVTFSNTAGLRLSGVLHEPHERSDAIVIMSHGFTGNRDEHGGFQKLGEALLEEGYSALRFDFSGSGESSPTDITIAKQVDDLKSTIAHSQALGYSRICLLGHSLGGLCSLKAFDSRIKTMILHAAPTKPHNSQRLQAEEAQRSFEKKGFAIIENSSGGKIRVDKEFILEQQSMNQSELLSNITCPVLLIHGSSDEVIPPDHSKTALPLLPQTSRLEIIAGKGHDFSDNIETTTKLCLDWCKNHL